MSDSVLPGMSPGSATQAKMQEKRRDPPEAYSEQGQPGTRNPRSLHPEVRQLQSLQIQAPQAFAPTVERRQLRSTV